MKSRNGSMVFFMVFLLMAGINLWTSSGFAQSRSQQASGVLVSHFPFDGNLKDVVSGKRGTASSKAVYVQGITGRAVSLYQSIVTLPNVDAWKLGEKDFSISLWVKRLENGFVSPHISILKGTGFFGDFQLKLNDKQNLLWRVHSLKGPMIDFTIHSPLTDEQWHNIVLIQEQGIRKWYLDGALQPETSKASIPKLKGTNRLGAQADGPGSTSQRVFVDDLRLYHAALSQDQVTEIFKNTKQITEKATVAETPDSGKSDTEKATVAETPDSEKSDVALYASAYYPFDGSLEESIAGNKATGVSAITDSPYVEGVSGKALSLELTIIKLPEIDVWQLDDRDFSISLWVKREETGSNDVTSILKLGGDDGGFVLHTTENLSLMWTIQTSPGEKENLEIDSLLADEAWHHLVLIQEKGVRRWYLNNKLRPETSDTKIPLLKGVNRMGIHNERNWYSIQKIYVDELRVFHMPLSADQVTELYENP